MLAIGQRLVTVAIAAQIGTDEREAVLQQPCDLVPEHMRLRVAMEQEQRRPLAARAHTDTRARCRDIEQAETGKEAVFDRNFSDAHQGRKVATIQRR
jgi:hypothetical protein